MVAQSILLLNASYEPLTVVTLAPPSSCCCGATS